MCVDYSNLYKACPKDSFPLSSIDRLVDGVSSFQVLNFLDAYSNYNQIKMYLLDADKTTFMMDGLTYCYQVMSFGLKNIGAIYQRLMDKVFANHIDRNIKVYVDNMVFKLPIPEEHIKDLGEIFVHVRKYDIRKKERHKTPYTTLATHFRLVLTLVTSAKRLRPYFHAHTIVIRIDNLIR
ncbi:hypothetical protein CR513_59744, partial [Mucuna pruriens]